MLKVPNVSDLKWYSKYVSRTLITLTGHGTYHNIICKGSQSRKTVSDWKDIQNKFPVGICHSVVILSRYIRFVKCNGGPITALCKTPVTSEKF